MVQEITASIICIGDELLIGQTVNTNAAWMGRHLNAIGIRMERTIVIADEREAIIGALGEARTHVVLMTGGLGPTQDDITKEALCSFFHTRLVRIPQIEAHVATLFQRLGREPLESNRAQADLPAAATLIPNTRGTATGMWFEREGRVFISMPGVPYEMQAMMEQEILPRLAEHFKPPAIVHRTILTTGLGESHLADRLTAWEGSLASERIKLAYLPSPGIVKLRLSAYAETDPDAAAMRIDRKVVELRKEIPQLIYGEGEERLELVIGQLLSGRKESLAIAESCTGGSIMQMITSVPGSSVYFLGGSVSYANVVKTMELEVPAAMIDEHGAVSREVVEQMAKGIRSRIGSTWSVATSGIAGPDGGSPDKPVGTVWMAVSGPIGVRSRKVIFAGSRELVIRQASIAALNMLRLELMEAPSS